MIGQFTDRPSEFTVWPEGPTYPTARSSVRGRTASRRLGAVRAIRGASQRGRVGLPPPNAH
jgi:hypothetical protein